MNEYSSANSKVDILGSTYSIRVTNEKDDARLKSCSGFTDFSSKEIVIDSCDYIKEESDEFTIPSANPSASIKEITRHEIIHAFLMEAGLVGNSLGVDSWAVNEEMIDWFAIMWPKIDIVFHSVGVL